jgi:Arc/MetJ-type ribon-helix-helix transcriptional regulator
MNESLTVRLSPKDVELIDARIEDGHFTSRSDVIRFSIRTTLRQMDRSEQTLDLLKRSARVRGIDAGTAKTLLKQARKTVGAKEYGDG